MGHSSPRTTLLSSSWLSLGRLEMRAVAPVSSPAPPLTLGLHPQVRDGPQLLAHNTEVVKLAVSGPAGDARCCPRLVPCTTADTGAASSGAGWATVPRAQPCCRQAGCLWAGWRCALLPPSRPLHHR